MTTKIPAELSSTPGISDSSDATAITITSAEKVGIGETSPLGTLHVKTADSGASADSGADELILENSGDAGVTIMSGTSNSGSIRFGDSDDNDNGIIIYNHDSSPYLRFFTGGSVRTRIDSDGLKFGSDTAAANALDDYEEGTWTPATNGTGVGITTYTATYTKIGDLVMYRCYVQISSNSASDAATISGLPFTNGGSNFWCAGSIWENNGKQPYVLVADGGSDTIQLRQSGGTYGSSHPYSDFSNTQIIITGTYKTLQ